MDEASLLSSRILALDDHPIQVKIFVKLLQGHGFSEVIGTSEADEALLVLNSAAFDLVILDLDMPELNGYQMMERIRQMADGDFIPVLVVTASRSNEELVRALNSGASDFISRPVHRDELVARVLNLLRVRQAYRKIPTALRIPAGRVAPQAIRAAKLLVVEDDPDQLAFIVRMLTTDGYAEVTAVTSLHRVPKQRDGKMREFDLVVLDLHLADMDTATAISTLKGSGSSDAGPFILAVTADEEKQTRWDSFALGVRDFIPKPLEREPFLAKVANLVRLRLLI